MSETELANGRNARNVWQIPTQGRPEAHFATFPDELPRRCILAGTSEHGVCADCGAPWWHPKDDEGHWIISEWVATCDHNAARVPATVLDPFIGSGTTVAVAQQLGRHGIGLDLNPDYLAIAAKRLAGISLPMAI